MFVSVVVIGLLVGWVFRADGGAVAEIGRPAPDFTVTLINGGTFTLSEHLKTDDRPIVLNLWASWCIPCRTETPDISAFAEANPDVKVIGVSTRGTETFDIDVHDDLEPRQTLKIKAARADGTVIEFEAIARVDTPIEVDYLRNGGILHYVLRRMTSV